METGAEGLDRIGKDATSILNELEKEGFIVVPTRGTSMEPLLHTFSTHVLIRKREGRPKKNDAVLFVRPGGKLVLHRIISLEGEECLIRGDNTFGLERVPLSAVRGVLETVWNGEREIHVTDASYRFYVWFWNRIYPLRFLKHQVVTGLAALGKLLLGNTSPGWVIKMARSSLGGILLLTGCTCLNAFLAVILAFVMREAVDGAVALNRGRFLTWVGIFLAIIVVQLMLRAVIRQQEEQVSASVENRLKEHTYHQILHSTYAVIRTYHTGVLQNRLTNDTKVVADDAALLLPGVSAMTVQLICALAALMLLDWRFGGLFLLAGVMLFGVTLLFRRRMKRLHRNVQEADGRLRSWLQESVECIQILKSFDAEDMAQERTREKADGHRRARVKRRTFSNICNIGFGVVMQGSYLFGLVWCGFGILRGTMTYGTLTAVLQLVGQIRSPLANISGYVPQYYSMIASAERLIEIEELPKDPAAEKQLPPFEELTASHLSFIYDDGEEEVIHDASFTVRKGEIVVLTGISGIGKSTLLRILLGLNAPTGGEITGSGIRIDAGTRPWFSYVPQGNMLMSGSIYEAVDFLHPAPYTKQQRAAIERACRIACADEFIRELPQGYDTVLGEKGAGLSEGQMQRLAIARALYRNAPVLLLDEATSALDEETEERLLGNLKETGQTVLIVTHRPAAMKICSKRLVFEHAKIRVKGEA